MCEVHSGAVFAQIVFLGTWQFHLISFLSFLFVWGFFFFFALSGVIGNGRLNNKGEFR